MKNHIKQKNIYKTAKDTKIQMAITRTVQEFNFECN